MTGLVLVIVSAVFASQPFQVRATTEAALFPSPSPSNEPSLLMRRMNDQVALLFTRNPAKRCELVQKLAHDRIQIAKALASADEAHQAVISLMRAAGYVGVGIGLADSASCDCQQLQAQLTQTSKEIVASHPELGSDIIGQLDQHLSLGE